MKKILIVDDEVDISAILVTFLSACGYETVAAKDGIEALEFAASERPDLILLDVSMPDMSGYQVVRMLKADVATAGIPVVMLTAKSHQSDRFWGLDSGADAYMLKPFDLKEVLGQIRSLIGA